MVKKTVVIWDSCETHLQYFVVDKDVSHLDGKYVNSVDCTDQESDAVSLLVYDDQGKKVIELVDTFPIQAVLDGAKVISAGFLL